MLGQSLESKKLPDKTPSFYPLSAEFIAPKKLKLKLRLGEIANRAECPVARTASAKFQCAFDLSEAASTHILLRTNCRVTPQGLWIG